MRQKISAGIVTYNPDINRLKENVNSIISQVDKVFIVDNASINIDEIISSFSDINNLSILENSDNLGIAKALNQICKSAEAEDYEWVLTLDQDTVCPNRMIEKMMTYTSKKNIGIVCPAVNYEGRKKTRKTSKKAEYVYACMTSASLTRISAWKKVSGFKNEYFIDFVDNEFCMKLAINGYKIIRINSCVISHILGDIIEKNFFGLFHIRFFTHSPWRYYYMVRNNRSFISEYKNNLNVLKELLKLWYIIFMGIAFSNERSATMKYITKGYMDAKKGITGKKVF